jgi:hypothetical protein
MMVILVIRSVCALFEIIKVCSEIPVQCRLIPLTAVDRQYAVEAPETRLPRTAIMHYVPYRIHQKKDRLRSIGKKIVMIATEIIFLT